MIGHFDKRKNPCHDKINYYNYICNIMNTFSKKEEYTFFLLRLENLT